jgi:hypothetical protein
MSLTRRKHKRPAVNAALSTVILGVKVMDNQGAETRAARPSADAGKLLLLAGLSVQVWGVIVAVGLIAANWAR